MAVIFETPAAYFLSVCLLLILCKFFIARCMLTCCDIYVSLERCLFRFIIEPHKSDFTSNVHCYHTMFVSRQLLNALVL